MRRMNPVTVLNATDSPSKGFEQVTSMATATSLTAPAVATSATIQAETQDIRWRDDGTDPTATVGMLLAAGESMHYQGDLEALRLIETAASASLNVTYR